MIDCLLSIASLCLFDPSGAYLTGEVAGPRVGMSSGEYAWCGHVARPCRGPMGILRAGMKVDLTRNITIDYGLMHSSFILENDRGFG